MTPSTSKGYLYGGVSGKNIISVLTIPLYSQLILQPRRRSERSRSVLFFFVRKVFVFFLHGAYPFLCLNEKF